MDWEKITPELTRKLDPSVVKPAKSFGPKGDYIEGWHAIAEANRIFGFGEWDHVLREVKCVSERPRKIGRDEKDGWAVSYVASVTVMVGGAKREDVGAGHGYDLDCGLAHESAIKEAVTDALKRALRTFGNPFGLALYDKSRENVGIDAPPYDARAVADRILASIARKDTHAKLIELLQDESDNLAELEAAAPAIRAEVRAAFKTRKQELTPQEKAA